MHLTSRIALAIVASALLVGGAWAEPMSSEVATTLTINAVDPDNGTIEATSSTDGALEIVIDEKTLIRRGDDEFDITRLREGDRIVVDATRSEEASRRLVAKRVMVVIDPQPDGPTVGEILSTDASAGTLTVQVDGADASQLFQVDGKRITIEGVPANLAELEIGDRVVVEHDTRPGSESGSESSMLVAREVKVERRAGVESVPGDAGGEPYLPDVASPPQ